MNCKYLYIYITKDDNLKIHFYLFVTYQTSFLVFFRLSSLCMLSDFLQSAATLPQNY